MARKQAKRGGEFGVNGDFYEGGKFLPSSENTIKGAKKFAKLPNATRKVEIENYVWGYAPEGFRPILPLFGSLLGFHKFDGCMEYNGLYINTQYMAYAGYALDFAQSVIDAWNSGARFMNDESFC